MVAVPELTRDADTNANDTDFESLLSENEFDFEYGNTMALLGDLEITNVNPIYAKTEIPNCSGKTLLHYVVESGNNETLLELLQQEFDINDKQPLFQWTPMHYAAANGHLLSMRILIEFGAEVNCRNYYLETPLHIATNTVIARRKCITT